MLDKSLETLFRRYRTRGDAKALGQVFDRTARELLAVAAHLGHGPAEAEDVVQETFLAALSAAKRWDERRPLMPWLVGILTREARHLRRNAARSVEPDRLAPRVSAAPTDEAEREELAAAIAEALRKVPTNYREVLVGHLADGLAPREIAERLGRAPGTVRVQLHRGLEHLRRALPPSFALGVAATALPGRGLAAVRAEVLAAAPVQVGVATATLPLRALAVAGAAAGVLGLTWTQLGGGAGLDGAPELELRVASAPSGNIRLDREDGGLRLAAPPDRAGAIAAVEKLVEERARRAAAAPDELPADPEAELPRAEVSWSVKGRLYYRGAIDATRAHVSLTADGAPLGATTPDERGNFLLDFTALMSENADPEAFVLRVDHPEFAVAVEEIAPRDFGRGPDYREVCTVKLRAPAGFVEGDVDTPGGPTRVALLPLTKGKRAERLVLAPSADETSTTGHFRLRFPEPGDYVVVAAQDERPPAWSLVSLDSRSDRTVLCGHLSIPAGHTLVGDLKLPPGVSAEGARVVSRPTEVEIALDLRGEATYVGRDGETVETLPWNGLLWNGRRFLRDFRTCDVNEEGRFELRGVAEDTHVLALRDFPGFEGERLALTDTWVPGPPLTLVPEISLLRVAVARDGEPAPRAPVRALDGTRRTVTGATDADGEVELVVRSARRLRLESSSPAGNAQRFVQSAVASRWVRVGLELGDAALVPGTIVDAAAPPGEAQTKGAAPDGGPAPPKNGVVLFLESEGPELLEVSWPTAGGDGWLAKRVAPEVSEKTEEGTFTVYLLPETGAVDTVRAASGARSWRSQLVSIEQDYRIYRLIEN